MILAFGLPQRAAAQSAEIGPHQTATITGTVTDSSGRPISGATVRLIGPTTGQTTTDYRGGFVFAGVSYGQYSLVVQSPEYGSVSRNQITIASDTTVAIQYLSSAGSNLKTIAQASTSARATINVTPASITSIDLLQQVLDGETSWRRILAQVPGVSSGGAYGGATVWNALPDGPLSSALVSINGTLPYETVTEIDQMPIVGGFFSTPGGGTDLATYPINGFGSEDIIRGPGADAPSIVDSIGGTLELHAPEEAYGNHVDLSVGTDPYGGTVGNVRATLRWDRLSATVSYGINDSPGPIKNGKTYGILEPSTIDGQPFFCTGACALSIPSNPNYQGYFAVYQLGFANCCQPVSSAWSSHQGSIALTYDITSSIRAEVFYGGSSILTYETPYGISFNFVPPAGYTGSLPSGVNVLIAPHANPNELYNESSSFLEEKLNIGIGQGVLTVAALQNRTFGSLNQAGSASAFTQHLYGGGCLGTAAPSASCPAGGTPTVFNGGSYSVTCPAYTYTDYSWTNNRDLLFSYSTQVGAATNVGISTIQSYYDNPYFYGETESGFNVFSGTQPSDDSSTTLETRVYLQTHPSDKWLVSLSQYFVDASYHVTNPAQTVGVGYTDESFLYNAPRLGIVWRPTNDIAVRAAAGGGFAEAPLSDLIGTNGSPEPDNPASPTYYQVSLTNLKLKPEESFGFDLGTDVRLGGNNILSFDVYRTTLYGQFYESTNQTGFFNGLPLFTSQYGNLGVSRYQGVLVDFGHHVPRGVYWNLAGGLTRGYVVSLPAGFYNTPAGVNTANTYVVPNVNFTAAYYGSFGSVPIPYSQGFGTFGYRWEPRKYAEVALSYFGPNNPYFRPAFVEGDINAEYPITKAVSIFASLRNFTGVYDESYQTFGAANVIGAPSVSGPPWALYSLPYGPRALIVTAKLSM